MIAAELNHDEWIASRRSGIGGSDAAAVLGFSKWKTPLQLWHEKRGESTPVTSPAMRWGTLLEPIIRGQYEEITKREVKRTGLLRSKRYPFALANIDGVTADDRLLEVKTARTSEGWGDEGTDDVPVEYFCQVQHYMAVTELPIADIAVLIGASDFRIYTVEADSAFQTQMMEREEDFWSLVESGIPPAPTSSQECLLRWPRSISGRTVPSSERLAALIGQIKVNREVIKDTEKLIDALELEVKSALGDAEALVDEDGKPLVTWKSTKPRVSFDVKQLEHDHPEIYANYLKEGKASRMFLVK